MTVTLQQMRVVVAVHDAGSFTDAAQHLHVAQSSLSRTVADVERRLGAVLFERTTRRVEATPGGREFVAAARRAIAAVEAELRHVDGVFDGSGGRVRIATLPSLAAILLPGVVSAFRGAQPDVTITIEDALAAEVLQRVRTAEADVAVTVLGEGAAWGGDVETTDDEDEFVVTPVATDRFCLLAQPLTRFAEESEVAWDEIAGTPFVAFHATTSIRRHVDHAFSMIGARPEIVVTARNIAAVAGLVDAGLGVTAVPGLVVPLTGFADLVHVPLVDPVVERRIVAVHARARPPIPAAAAFLAALTGGSRPSLPTHARWVSW